MKDIVVSSSVKETFNNHHNMIAALSPPLSSASSSSLSLSPASTRRLKTEHNNINNNNIDTPARMKKEIVFNYFIANKVELVDLESKSNKPDNSSCLKTDHTSSNKASKQPTPPRNKQSTVAPITTANTVNKSEKRISIPSVTLSPPPTVKRLSTSFLFYPYSNLAALIMNSDQFTKNGSSSGSTCSSSTSSTASLFDPNKIHLFVKAGQDGRSQGACPFCQDVFMQLLVKAQTNKFNFDVITINMDNPPKEFKELCIKPPVLIHGSTKLLDGSKKNSDCIEDCDESTNASNAIVLSDVDEIAEYLDRVYPNSPLIVNNPEAKKVCLNVFSKFSFFIRDVSSKSTSLEAELEKIDAYLRDHCDTQQQQRRCFLNGENMSQLDCSLLPKLQHIRVACESIKRFRIPARFRHLWRYMHHAYQTDAFQKSCPPDREIIWNWAKNILSHRELLQIVQEAPYKTLTITDDVPI